MRSHFAAFLRPGAYGHTGHTAVTRAGVTAEVLRKQEDSRPVTPVTPVTPHLIEPGARGPDGDAQSDQVAKEATRSESAGDVVGRHTRAAVARIPSDCGFAPAGRPDQPVQRAGRGTDEEIGSRAVDAAREKTGALRSSPGVTVGPPATEVGPAEYDAHLDRMIAAAADDSAKVARLSYTKRKGWVVPAGPGRIFTRGR